MIEEWFIHENVSYLSMGSNRLFIKSNVIIANPHWCKNLCYIACDVVYSTSELILSLTASPQEAGYSMPRSTH